MRARPSASQRGAEPVALVIVVRDGAALVWPDGGLAPVRLGRVVRFSGERMVRRFAQRRVGW
jgi:hypothetical protein